MDCIMGSFVPAVNSNVMTTAIPSGADLNTYESEGWYATANSTTTNSLSNCPHTGSGIQLFVKSRTGPTTQYIIIGEKIYGRRKTSAGWGAWYLYQGVSA